MFHGKLLDPSGLARLRRLSPLAVLSCALMLGICLPTGGQTVSGPNAQPASEVMGVSLPDAPLPHPAEAAKAEDKDAVTLRNTPLHILEDQGAIWTSPLRIRAHDLAWLAPLTLATGAAIGTDHKAMSSVVSHDATFNHANADASNVLTGGLIAIPVALFGIGQFHADGRATEAGILSGEALLDGVVVEQGMKLAFWRERPALDSARGRFFQSGAGADSSFPSSHSVLAWSSAAVIAGEYPSHWVQFGVYSMAAGVSVTRVLGQEHFPSDVLVGSAAGWLVGHYVYRKHHRFRVR
jgi:membrane-associated phospholipid phosphatase